MRLIVLSVLLLTAAGCTSHSGVGALEIAGPSPEKTSSIVRPQAVVPEEGETIIERTADAGMTALAEEDSAPAPALEHVAMLAPVNPGARPKKMPKRHIYAQKFRDAKPVNFGRHAPQHHPVHGVDVSRWQGDIDWPKLRRHGANFAYIKATDGIDHVDPMFTANWTAARRAGIRRGAYHFFYWCRTAAEQAEWFIRNVPKEKGALPPVLDVEWNHDSACKWRPSRDEILEKMQVFLDRLERHYGQRPVIYTAPDFYADNLRGAFPNHAFWLRSVAAHPAKTYPGRKWLFWQYSGSGLSHGVAGRIDLNVFGGDEADWWRWLGKVTG